MPTLTQLINGTSDPTLVQLAHSNPVVEPLDGPSTVDQVFDRFPEEVYQQGKDSHLYRFLQALGGDAGAGFIKAQVYAARLQFEAEFLDAAVLDSFYASQFRLQRLKSETYPTLNPETDALPPLDWETIALADQHYRQRVAEFWTATRNGTNPDGMRYGAQAGIGVECEIVENYKWIFDQYSDDPLGLTPIGTTASAAEFIIVPHSTGASDADNYEFAEDYPYTYSFTPASLPTSRPALGGTPPSVTVGVGTTAETTLLPELERNALDILDRLRPTGSLASIHPEQTRYSEVSCSSISASSERIIVNRLVTGQTNVPWPAIDRSQAYFIQEGLEQEAGYFKNSARELPIIFLTVGNAHAYTELALADPTYNTSGFYAGGDSISPYANYTSVFYGFFSPYIQALYPFLNTISSEASFAVENAVAINETPLILEARLA